MSKNNQLAELAARAEGPLLFWGRSLQNFRQICSLFPSSPFVGRAMSWAIADRPASHVVELGAGTGAVTRQLMRYSVASDQLTLKEIDSQLGGHLRRSFPEVDVIISPAQELARLWRRQRSPVPERICEALNIKGERYCRVWINLPPAGIWVYRKPL
jgi:phosphatidylethanolamine/phosphatidyl-N-methylethanolamine N-methyltransferase